jgi:hypothetical protein
LVLLFCLNEDDFTHYFKYLKFPTIKLFERGMNTEFKYL